MPESRGPRKNDPKRAELLDRLVRYSDLNLRSRNKERARKIVRDAALRWYKEFPEHRKDPEALAKSFMERFEKSRGIEALLQNQALDLDALSHAIFALYIQYDDDALPASPASVVLGVSRHDISSPELQQREKLLRQAADVLQVSNERELAARVSRVMVRYQRALRAAGKRRRRRPGAPSSPAGNVAQALDLALNDVPLQAERHRLIAQLVSDFIEKKTSDQIRFILKERYRER